MLKYSEGPQVKLHYDSRKKRVIVSVIVTRFTVGLLIFLNKILKLDTSFWNTLYFKRVLFASKWSIKLYLSIINSKNKIRYYLGFK